MNHSTQSTEFPKALNVCSHLYVTLYHTNLTEWMVCAKMNQFIKYTDCDIYILSHIKGDQPGSHVFRGFLSQFNFSQI